MKRHSLMITAAALAAAMVLGTGCAKKPGVETSETVTSQASLRRPPNRRRPRSRPRRQRSRRLRQRKYTICFRVPSQR